MLNNCGPSGSPPNAATLAGIMQAAGAMPHALEQHLQALAAACEETVEARADMKGKSCRARGVEKHRCCHHKLLAEQAQNPKGPRTLYSDCAFDKHTGQMIGRNNPVRGGTPARVPRQRSAIIRQAIGFAAVKDRPVSPTIRAFLANKRFPDVVIVTDPTEPPGPDNTEAIYDFKFPCPKTKQPEWGDNGKQGKRYKALLNSPGNPKMVTPTMVIS